MTTVDRKVAELRHKLAGIGADFARWRAETEPGRPLRKHHTQVVRLTDRLGGMVGRIDGELDTVVAGGGDDVLRECRRLQLRMLEVHRLWDFYRAKLNLRYVEWYRPFLTAVDEFAWLCYAPAAAGSDREAPLVHLSGEFSPFTHLRETPFAVEDVPDALNTADFLGVVTKLPIPVIGLPWYQLVHLPDAPVIAHEVGHAVERDFGLLGTVRAVTRPVFRTMPEARRDAWDTWLPEVFADLYGVLAAGPAFASTLADLLVVDDARMAAELTGPVQVHPPAAVRLALAATALAETGFPATPVACGPFEDDVAPMTGALLAGPYPGLGDRPLREVIAFTAAQQANAVTAADGLVDHQRPETSDVRCLIAAARLAFDRRPALFAPPPPGEVNAQDLVLDKVAKAVGDGSRADHGDDVPAADDRAAGVRLYDLIDEMIAKGSR
ncbi:hypothetical protein FHX81_8095 [Saccharothrix saharensis]|uniref:Uncharacterized protein n=1 Tax=Saccharothrix saharensis TaxID=571190 RepID=A0A543JRX0_9PSEU|nr:hypothetical protein [Saccharothrix saharensis]TQM85601.1 hypothetical protein FHX81_8095 [Saccharothrix saharensis]